MPQYHFHTLHGRPLRDSEGEPLADDAAARRQTLRVMGEILRDGPINFFDAGPFQVLCTDKDGVVIAGLVADRMSEDAVAWMLRTIQDHDAADD